MYGKYIGISDTQPRGAYQNSVIDGFALVECGKSVSKTIIVSNDICLANLGILSPSGEQQQNQPMNSTRMPSAPFKQKRGIKNPVAWNPSYYRIDSS